MYLIYTIIFMKKIFTIILFFTFIGLGNVYSQSCSANTSGDTNWSALSWNCTGGGNAPLTEGITYTENLIVGGGNDNTLFVNISLKIDGDFTINTQSYNIRVRSGKTLHITGDIINNMNNVTFYVEAGAFLIVEGTLNGKNSNLFGGPGTITGGNLDLKNSAGCVGGDCPTIIFTTCSAGGTFCADNNNTECIVNNTISASSTICGGLAVDLTATTPSAGSGVYSYRWEKSTTSATTGFTNASGNYTTASSYNTGVLTQTTWFRRVVSDAGTPRSCYINNTSAAIKITVNPSIAITTQPTHRNICSNHGSNVTFSVNASGPGTLSYKWQENTGSGWVDRANTNGYTNATTASLTISATRALANNGYQYRVIISSAATCGAAVTSNEVKLSVNPTTGGGWLGTGSSWTDGANWCGGNVPSPATNVIINPGAIMPIVSAAATCNNLTITTGASVTISANTLTVNGILTTNSGGALNVTGAVSSKGAVVNYGSISGTGTMTLNGTTNQSISGAGTFGNVTLSNGTGATASSPITISGTLTLSSGAFTSNGNLTMDLTSGNISNAGSGTMVGSVIYSKTIPSAGYHYISIPSVTNKTAADWDDDVTLSFGQYKNLYYYDETIVSSDKLVGWTALTAITDVLNPLKGYALYFPGSRVIDVTNTYTHAATASAITLTNTASSDPNSDGWNLVGNPYPTTVDWDVTTAGAWTKTGIGNSIYFWDPVNLRYASYVGQIGGIPGTGTNGGSRYIPSMQAFWVRVNSVGSGTFNVGNAARVSTQNPAIWRMSTQHGQPNSLKIVAKNSASFDETVIRFVENAVDTFESHLDAYKMFNEGTTPSIYTKSGEDLYSINTLSDTITDLALPLHLKGVAGAYSISVKDLENFDNSYSIFLEDQLLNKDQNLRLYPNYSFQVEENQNTDRFILRFKKRHTFGDSPNSENSNSILIWSHDQKVDVLFNEAIGSEKANILIFNVLGEKVTDLENVDIASGKITINCPFKTGVYIVKVVTKSTTHSARVFLSNQ